MNRPKAIERLQQRVKGEFAATDPENVDDMKLGIEALEFLETMGVCPYCQVPFTLPSETEE